MKIGQILTNLSELPHRKSMRKLEIFWETYPHRVSITEQIIKLRKQEGVFSL